ncbi:MAG: exodeoxyribonuclease VII small subunit [Elusimicrobia bacterium]|nr:exodeoxyribonuclease VII small subunit [Candidatus Liberimonas magnetica]
MKFEEAMKRLEEIVNQMEAGDVDLDKTLANFEEGIRLVRFCSSKLEEAKKKIEILVKKDGKLAPEPFIPENEEKEARQKKDPKKNDTSGMDLF